MKRIDRRLRYAWLLAAGTAAIVLGGCSRRDYRLRADTEVDELIAEKSYDPRWAVPPGMSNTLYQDPRSRYFDPFDPDAPPMPPDDPESHRLLRCVDGKKGWPHWDDWGHRFDLENPTWRETLGDYVELNESGEIVLTVDSALRVAIMNSPSYQQQVETLYLSALDVSTERFRLDTQFFGGNDSTFLHNGRLRSGAGETNSLTTATDFQLRRRFATAGELLVGFANSFVWQFAGPDTNATTSIVNFNLVQPLLRNAGRDIALEQLTIVERGLLANLRAYQRYREGYYTSVVIGDLGVTGPQRRGGFFGGTGLTGFTGQGSGGLGGVGAATGFGRAGFGGGGGAAGGGGAGFAGGGAGNVGGFIGLLQSLQQIRNSEDSLSLQTRTLFLLEDYLDAGFIDLVQVDQFRQSIETERATLIQSRNGFENQLDGYRTGTLGLPPDVPIALDDSIIRQFQFVGRGLTRVLDSIAAINQEIGELPDDPSVEQIRNVMVQAMAIEQRLAAELSAIENVDLATLEQVSDHRERTMDSAALAEFRKVKNEMRTTLEQTRVRILQLEMEIAQMESALNADNREQTINQLARWLLNARQLGEEGILIQARARLEAVVLDPLMMDSQFAFRLALERRLDVMNNRAALVDSWRLIAFNADRLQSDLNIVFSGDVRTNGNNPLKFQGPTGTLRAGLQFDAPFTRLLERNNYRQALIDYQQDRRQFIQFQDGVHQSLRGLLRQLDQLQVNLEIQRRAVAISIRRVDATQQELYRPRPAGEPFGPTAALNLLTALSDLRNTQNNFMSVWLNHYATRMVLYRDLGVMQLDEYGRWIDMPLEMAIGDAPGRSEPLPAGMPPGPYGAGPDLPPPTDPRSAYRAVAPGMALPVRQWPNGQAPGGPAATVHAPGADPYTSRSSAMSRQQRSFQ